MHARYMHGLQIVYSYGDGLPTVIHPLHALPFLYTSTLHTVHRGRPAYFIWHTSLIAVATGMADYWRHASSNQWIVRAVSVYLKLIR
jgi:hypothetical protein